MFLLDFEMDEFKQVYQIVYQVIKYRIHGIVVPTRQFTLLNYFGT